MNQYRKNLARRIYIGRKNIQSMVKIAKTSRQTPYPVNIAYATAIASGHRHFIELCKEAPRIY